MTCRDWMYCLGFGLVVAAIGVPALADGYGFHCAAKDATPEARLELQGEVLTVVEGGRTATLDASVEGEPPENFSISAAGEGEALLPAPDVMDACLAQALKTNGAAANDEGMVAYLANGCLSDLAGQAVVQKAALAYQVIVLAPDPAQLFVVRTYLSPSTVTGKPLALPEWPMRTCARVP